MDMHEAGDVDVSAVASAAADAQQERCAQPWSSDEAHMAAVVQGCPCELGDAGRSDCPSVAAADAKPCGRDAAEVAGSDGGTESWLIAECCCDARADPTAAREADEARRERLP